MSTDAAPTGPVLAIDTSTHRSVAALATADGSIASSAVDVGRRHGPALMGQLDGLFGEAGLRPSDVALIVAGTGPGSFTGLRVGLATAKTIAYVTGAAIVGVSSVDALRAAAMEEGMAGPDAVVVLPAGAHDHYLAAPGEAPRLIAPGALADSVRGRAAIAVGVDSEDLDAEAGRRGDAALAALPRALVRLGRAAALAGPGDVATLVPAYVALPRGIGSEVTAWSPDLRSA